MGQQAALSRWPDPRHARLQRVPTYLSGTPLPPVLLPKPVLGPGAPTARSIPHSHHRTEAEIHCNCGNQNVAV